MPRKHTTGLNVLIVWRVEEHLPSHSLTDLWSMSKRWTAYQTWVYKGNYIMEKRLNVNCKEQL